MTGDAWADNALVASAGVLVVLLGLKILAGIAGRFSHSPHLIVAFLDKIGTPVTWVMVFLALQFVWEAAPDRLHMMTAVRHGTALCLIASITWLGLRLIAALVALVTLTHPITASDNLQARRLQTQSAVISRALMTLVYLVGVSCALMTFPSVRQIGASLLASAGVAGLIAGLAARPVLSNMIAGLQLALTQPIRLDDVLIIEGEWGRVEEITGAFVVVALWDQRRLIVPLQWFIEHPFQNWSRASSDILGTVFLWVDYCLPLESLRHELQRLCESSTDWDGRIALLQVTDTNDRAMQLRALVSSSDSPRSFDLRCHVREGMIAFIAREYADSLPRVRAQLHRAAPVKHPP